MKVRTLLEKEGLILAGLTAYMYLASYIKMWTRSYVYQIPLDVMSVGVMDLTLSASLMACSAIMVFLIIYVVFRGIDSNNKVIRKSFVFIKILAPAIATFLFCRTTDLSYADSAIIGGVVLVLFAFLTIKELINIKDYIDHGYDEDKFYLTTLIEGRSILSYSFYFLILLAFLFCMFIDTYLSSKKERNFDVFYKGDYYAVISYSSDSLVAKKIINKQLSGDFFIFKLEALENIGINKKNITSLSGGPPSARQLRRLVEPHSANRQSR